MKHFITSALLIAGIVPVTVYAQAVDLSKYPDYSSAVNPDYSLLEPGLNDSKVAVKNVTSSQLPDHVDNSRLKFFPPVFNQDGGSCGSASRICYMFTHELNAYRNLDAKSLANRYPSHFVWLLTFGNSGKDEFVQHVGVPSAEVYGGTTYSALFGNQDAGHKDFGWMQGYDKWYSAMFNRMLRPAHFPLNVSSKEGREAVKRWLYNHNGDNSFYGGGIAGIGVASGGDWQPIPKTPTNDEIGATGKMFVKRWGTQVDHALTIVGYDDRIEFDLNGNGIKGEASADEKGAWIIVNSWSDGWCNNGFVYCPYAYAGASFRQEGSNYYFSNNWWAPEIYKVRKDYRPLRTIKIKMDYSHRSEICLSAGVSSDLNATTPDKVVAFEHFKYAGDGNGGNTNPAPAVPMLGKWADGKLHDEPMEFGYDLTDISSTLDKNMPLKYFFIVETRSWAGGSGHIYNASIIDYEHDLKGIETPFPISGDNVKIESKGNKTIISTIVYGNGFHAPQNLALNENVLNWQAPLYSGKTIEGYNIYCNGMHIDKVAGNVTSYQLPGEVKNSTYSVTACYANRVESAKVSVNTPVVNAPTNQVVNLRYSGFSIPNIFTSKLEEATIEYWINPNSINNWNQSAGPGWGTFMLHANGNGSFTAGWNTGAHRAQTAGGKLRVGAWSHVAITVKKNTMKIFINGVQSATVTSDQYSGIGGFGNLVWNPNGNNNNTDAHIDEIRIWNYAKEQKEIDSRRNVQYSGNMMPKGLLAYYKGDTISVNGKNMLREYINGNHAEILNDNFMQKFNTALKLNNPTGDLTASIVQPEGTIYAGIPANFSANYNDAINQLIWNAEGAGVKDLKASNPSFTFKQAGEQLVYLSGYNAEGEAVHDTCTVKVEATPEADATFTISKQVVSAGEHVTFLAKNPMIGYAYAWSMPGAEVDTATSTNAAATYNQQGDYEVTLTVTSPDGKQVSSKQTVKVAEVAPVADFDVTPAVILKGETCFLKDKSRYTPNAWSWTLHSTGKTYVVKGQNSSFTTMSPGIYDVSLTVANNTGNNTVKRERVLTVCNADSKNGLNFTNGNAQLKLTKVPFSNGTRLLTIDWWMKPANVATFSCGIGQEGTWMFKADQDGHFALYNGSSKQAMVRNYIIAGEWHHYAVVFSNGSVTYYRDGVQISKVSTNNSKIPALDEFTFSSKNAPFFGQIDEFRVWNAALSLDNIKQYANAPIADVATAVADDKLAVYYNFNQSGGNVKDWTGNNNEGIRLNFGPDGDAWGLSKGVFCLNFEGNESSEVVTDQYLKNCKAPFKCNAGKPVNPTNSNRFLSITDWTLENSNVNDGVTTSVHVDKQKNDCFTWTSGWDNFNFLKDHKAYQTVTLPAGNYTFKASYGTYEGACGDSYLVAAVGKTLPDTENIHQSLGAKKMLDKGQTKTNEVQFVLDKETEVSIGLVITLNGRQCCTIKEFELTRDEVEFIEADGANGYDLNVDANGYATLALPYATLVPDGVTAYVAKEVTGDKVMLEPIADGIVPARTGVVISATAGTYHFEPSTEAGRATSILVGTYESTAMDNDKRYYQFEATSTPGFYLFEGSELEGKRAYLTRDMSESKKFFGLNIVPTGIDEVAGENKDNTIYDLSGRIVKEPAKGIYITNGKKVVVK